MGGVAELQKGSVRASLPADPGSNLNPPEIFQAIFQALGSPLDCEQGIRTQTKKISGISAAI